jgi:predicted transcriptional regulator
MTAINELRSQRIAVEISAIRLASKARVNRSRLSELECGHAQPTPDELRRLTTALGELIHAKEVIRQAADSVGWSGVA